MEPYRVRVIYGDTDQMGVVYYANYLRYFELARGEYIRALGLRYSEIESARHHAAGVRGVGAATSSPRATTTCSSSSPRQRDATRVVDALRVQGAPRAADGAHMGPAADPLTRAP